MRALLHKIAAVLVAYGPWGVLLLSLADSAGIPLPAAMDALVIGTAAASARTPSKAWLTAAMAVLGSVAGNIFLFQAVLHGRRLFSKTEPDPRERRRFRDWFSRYGLLTVFIPAVVPVIPLPLKVFVILAGAFHTPVGKFLAVIVTARLIRYFGLAWLGIRLGQDAQGFLARNAWTMGGLALLMAFGLYLLIRLRGQAAKSPN